MNRERMLVSAMLGGKKESDVNMVTGTPDAR